MFERGGTRREDCHRQRSEGIGRSDIHFVFGIGERRRVPAVRCQCHGHGLPGHARSDAAHQQLRSRHRSHGARVASHRCDEQHRARGSTTVAPGTFFQQVTPQQADLSQPWAASLELYITPWGFLKGAAESNTTVTRRRADGKNYNVLTWSPKVTAPSGKNYVVNGYVNEQGLVERIETWLGDTIMGDMHVLATYSGWKDFGGVMAPSKIVQTRGGWPFFEVSVTAARGNPADLASLVAPPSPGPARGGGPPAAGARPSHDRDVRKTWRWTLPAHHGRRQLRFAGRRVQGPHHDARGGTI